MFLLYCFGLEKEIVVGSDTDNDDDGENVVLRRREAAWHPP